MRVVERESQCCRSTRASTNPGANVGKSFFGFHCGIAKSGGVLKHLFGLWLSSLEYKSKKGLTHVMLVTQE